ncbi:MAG: TlpA family protein disulfide reductase [Pyrinomonadaceae bacterium]|nr:TlpA family protein disulfide reductase [Pyrinomonadaceae bacterium]
MPTSNTGARKAALSLLIACAVFLVACNRKVSSTTSEATPVLSGPPNTTYPMPPLKTEGVGAEMGWTLVDGRRAKLADFRGQVLILDFYATWCAPCRKSIPHLGELQRRSGTRGLQVVGLNVGGPDDRVKVAAFAAELNIPYALGFPDKPLSDLFLSDDDSIPQTFVFDRGGQLVKRFIGYDDSIPKELEQTIQSALMVGSK